jgi:D-amino peptidase
MRVYISVDMEGISGLVRWADVVTAGMDYQQNRRFMTEDAKAAIAGAFDGGATKVVVEENHGVEELCDLVLDAIDPRCRVVRGAGRPTATTMAGLDAACGVVLLVAITPAPGRVPASWRTRCHTSSSAPCASAAARAASRSCSPCAPASSACRSAW